MHTCTSRARSAVSACLGLALVLGVALASLACDSPTDGGASQVPAVVAVTPAVDTLEVGNAVTLSAEVRDRENVLVPGASVAWSSSDTSLATVSASGVVTAHGVGVVQIIATVAGQSGAAQLTTVPTTFSSVSTGYNHSCGLTASGAAYCWGSNGSGQLGAGSRTELPTPVHVPGHTFKSISAGEAYTCAVTAQGVGYCWGMSQHNQGGTQGTPIRPTVVPGGHTWQTIVAGDRHTCGLTLAGKAYCWGLNEHGQVGGGTVGGTALPVTEVTGGHTFTRITVGHLHTCAITSAGAAYCWGRGSLGELGNGSTTPATPSPVPVGGSHLFRSIDAGSTHTCGLTRNRDAYCWGHNGSGQLGTDQADRACSGNPCSAMPVLVTGGVRFGTVVAGVGFSCGVSLSGVAHCWGDNERGQLGDGSSNDRAAPAPVTGLGTVKSFGGGAFYHACAVANDGAASCWGQNERGQLGTPSSGVGTCALAAPVIQMPCSKTPVAVPGHIAFARPNIDP